MGPRVLVLASLLLPALAAAQAPQRGVSPQLVTPGERIELVTVDQEVRTGVVAGVSEEALRIDGVELSWASIHSIRRLPPPVRFVDQLGPSWRLSAGVGLFEAVRERKQGAGGSLSVEVGLERFRASVLMTDAASYFETKGCNEPVDYCREPWWYAHEAGVVLGADVLRRGRLSLSPGFGINRVRGFTGRHQYSEENEQPPRRSTRGRRLSEWEARGELRSSILARGFAFDVTVFATLNDRSSVASNGVLFTTRFGRTRGIQPVYDRYRDPGSGGSAPAGSGR